MSTLYTRLNQAYKTNTTIVVLYTSSSIDSGVALLC